MGCAVHRPEGMGGGGSGDNIPFALHRIESATDVSLIRVPRLEDSTLAPFFGGTVAHVPIDIWTARVTSAEWVSRIPAGCRVVFDLKAGSEKEARDLAAMFRDL